MQQMHHNQYNNLNSFQMHHNQTFPPQSFQHQQPMFDQMSVRNSDSPMADISFDVDMHHSQADLIFPSESLHAGMGVAAPPMHPSTEK